MLVDMHLHECTHSPDSFINLKQIVDIAARSSCCLCSMSRRTSIVSDMMTIVASLQDSEKTSGLYGRLILNESRFRKFCIIWKFVMMFCQIRRDSSSSCRAVVLSVWSVLFDLAMVFLIRLYRVGHKKVRHIKYHSDAAHKATNQQNRLGCFLINPFGNCEYFYSKL